MMKSPDQDNFLSNVKTTIKTFSMLSQKDSVLVAVSGGPDSVALFLSMFFLKEAYNLTLGIAHLNHLLRDDEAQRDEDFVRALAAQFDVPIFVKQKDIKTFSKAEGFSIEEAGREARYTFFNMISNMHHYSKIATGHTRDDNAEQVLMNLLRGSGSKGLTGIPPVRENILIRPLINISKKEIEAFLTESDQAYMVDSTNTDPIYLRNRIRHELIPLLQSNYNPEITTALDRLSHILSQENDYFDQQVEKMIDDLCLDSDMNSISFLKSKICKLHPALLNRLLRTAILRVKTNLRRISLLHITDIVNFIHSNSPGTKLDLPDKVRVYKNKDVILIKQENKSLRDMGKKEKQIRQMLQKNRQKGNPNSL